MPDLPSSIVAALIGAVMVLVGLAAQTWLGWSAFTQKLENDHRDQQWKRIQWAIDLSLLEGERELEISGALLEHLAAETYQEPSDLLVIQTALESVNKEATAQMDQVLAELEARLRGPAGPVDDGQETADD